MRTLVLVVLAVTTSCATSGKVSKYHRDIVQQGIGCAELFWAGYPLPRAQVSKISIGAVSVRCGSIERATGCWDPADMSIYLNASGQRDKVVQTMAHEWSHAMWHPLAEYDPTHDVVWRLACDD